MARTSSPKRNLWPALFSEWFAHTFGGVAAGVSGEDTPLTPPWEEAIGFESEGDRRTFTSEFRLT